MNKLLLNLSFCLCLASSVCGQYTVTKVVGRVRDQTTGETLLCGSRIGDMDLLAFSHSSDLVRMLIPGKGVVILGPSLKAAKKEGELVEIVKYTLHLNSREGSLSGRGGGQNLLNDELKTDSRVNPFVLIERNNKYIFDAKKYNVRAGSTFFLQVNKSNESIKELPCLGDTLFLDQSVFPKHFVNGKDTNHYKIGFYDKQRNLSLLIAEIHPYFDQAGEMEKIIQVYLANEKKKTGYDLERACYNEVYGALGKPSTITFQECYAKMVALQQKN